MLLRKRNKINITERYEKLLRKEIYFKVIIIAPWFLFRSDYAIFQPAGGYKEFYLHNVSTKVAEPSERILGGIFPAVKQLVRKADRSLNFSKSSTERKSIRSPLIHIYRQRNNFTLFESWLNVSFASSVSMDSGLQVWKCLN